MTGRFNGHDDDEKQSIDRDGVGSGGGDRSHGGHGFRRSLEEGDVIAEQVADSVRSTSQAMLRLNTRQSES